MQRPDTVPQRFVGLLDPPAENVERELVPLFPNGRHVVLAEMGHVSDLWNTAPAQTKDILTSFLEGGVVTQESPEVIPMTFELTVGFPAIAKLIVGGGALILLLLATGLALLVRRVVRTRARLR